VFKYGTRTVYSVLARANNLVLAAGPMGVRRSLDGGSTWKLPAYRPGGTFTDMHALGGDSDFFAQDQAYVVNSDTELWYTEDDGNHWAQIASAPLGGGACGGISFVKAVANTSSLDLYFGNRCWPEKLTAPAIPGTNHFDYSGQWRQLSVDHKDARDLAFDSVRQPLLLATDGGLHNTADGGLSWQLVGGGRNGYNALQITEVRGQWIDDIERYDMYFGTQDNDLWSSSDEGATWEFGAAPEGFHIELLPHVATAADSQVTFVLINGSCGNCLSGALFSNIGPWPNPPGPVVGNPKIIQKSFFVQAVSAEAPSPFEKGLAFTTNLGASWRQYSAFPEDCLDLPKVSSGSAGRFFTEPVIYQPIRTGFYASQGFEIDQLVGVVKNKLTIGNSSAGFLFYPAMNNFGGLGINPTMFAWYEVFGVDPGNAYHIIAPDAVNQKLMQTFDGGNNWTEIPQLTSLITNNGELLFNSGIFTQATVVSFSEDNSNMVAIGSWEAGIFISQDNGLTWSKVPESERVTHITSIAWRTDSEAIVSSYGRGLWRVAWNTVLPPSAYNHFCEHCPLQFIPIPDPPQDWTTAALVFDGAVLGETVKDGVQEIFVSPGSSVALFSNSLKVLRVKVTETTRFMGFIGSLAVPQSRDGLPSIVGLTFDERGRLMGLVFSDKHLTRRPRLKEEQKEEQEEAREEEHKQRKSPTEGKPYVQLAVGQNGRRSVPPGAPLRLTGKNFPPGTTIQVQIDARNVATVRVPGKGEMVLEIPAPREFGLHSISFLKGPKGQILDGTMFLVGHEDKPLSDVEPKPPLAKRADHPSR